MNYVKILSLENKSIDENSTPEEVKKHMVKYDLKEYDIWLTNDMVVCVDVVMTPGRFSRAVLQISKESGTLRYVFDHDKRFNSLKTLVDYVYKVLVKFNKKLTKDLSDDKFTK